MLKRLTIAVFLVLVAFELEAQVFPFEFWYSGEVKTKDGAVLEGMLRYDLERDILQLEQNGRVQSFHAAQLISFTLSFSKYKGSELLKEEQVKRYFYSFPLTNRFGFKREHFFEVIVEGKATLLAREYVESVHYALNKYKSIELKRMTVMAPQVEGSRTRQILSHKMYLASLDGQIRELPYGKKEILGLFHDYEKEMKALIRSEALELEHILHMKRFFERYNELSEGED